MNGVLPFLPVPPYWRVGPLGPGLKSIRHADMSHCLDEDVRGWRMISSLADSGRDRRLLRHHTRSAPPCGVSCGPRACWVRVPADSFLSESGGRRLLFSDLHELRQDVLVMLLEVASYPLVSDQPPQVSPGQHKVEVVGSIRLLD